MIYNHGSQKIKSPPLMDQLPNNRRFFPGSLLLHDNGWFFNVFEIPSTHSSWILGFLQRTETRGSLILKFL
jgi:hypothetical protein